MVKFKIIADEKIAKTVQDRVVCDITELRLNNFEQDPTLGKIVSWRGTVNDEFFSILFVKGLLEISLVEREMLLGQNLIFYARTELSDNANNNANISYSLKDSNLEQDNITFVDVMVTLKWKYAPNVKFYHDEN